jgi:ribonuclease HI
VDNEGWNWNLLATWVPDHIKAKIAALLPPSNNAGADGQVCKGNAIGCFSIAEMYYALCDFDLHTIDPVWHQIWRLKVPERVRAFIWMVKHDRLLTNERKHRMGLGSDLCDFCRDCTETTIHVLRDCKLVQNLWISLVDVSLRYQFFTCDLNDWIAINVGNKGRKSSYDDWSCTWAMACHMVWTWRNKEKYDANFIRPIKQTEVIRQRITCYGLADRIIDNVSQFQQAIIQIGWTPPGSGWVCLNVDGACRDGVIGCGGVIRGSVGEWISGFSKFIGSGDAYIAELWGVFEGINLARQMNFTKVEVRIDSIEVVNDILNKKPSRMGGKAIVGRICQLLELDWDVVVTHVYREANCLADALASHSFSVKDKVCFFQDCPSFCKHQLDADEKGIVSLRNVFV